MTYTRITVEVTDRSAVQGGCIGGGVDLVAACDMRCCTRDAAKPAGKQPEYDDLPPLA